MSKVTGKRETLTLDGTPDKRLFWSIISDYDIQTALCELIDNAIDQWMLSGSSEPLIVEIELDADRQLIDVCDNAGGIARPDLRMLIAPGSSRNSPASTTIGIFGIGSKRAVVALAENVAIKTHSRGDKTYQIDITSDWLESPDWDLPAYEVPDITAGVTSIALSALRKTFVVEDIQHIKQHLGETYSWFLAHGHCDILVNKEALGPLSFETWAYPPDFAPQRANFDVTLPGSTAVHVDLTVGLIRDRDPELENYGVYFYCNNRLVAKEVRAREVGYFVTSEAGVPHPDASLCRAVVKLNGEARLMPWNSSKTGINFSHPLFHAVRPTLIQLVARYSSLSRRFKNDWEGSVFKHFSGELELVDPEAAARGKKLVLPPLPKINKPHAESLKAKNRSTITNEPWTLGLIEAMAAVTALLRQKLETKNRLALILLDSNFEIALKEFIVHRSDLFPPKTYTDVKIRELFSKRYHVVSEVSSKVAIPQTLVDKAKHYYELRNKLIHERATVGITDSDVEIYESTIREILAILFGLDL